MTFDASQLQAAIRRLAAQSGKTKREVCETAAKGFVKTVVGITPPASAKASGAAAKKAGEKAILGDVSRLAAPATSAGRGRDGFATVQDLLTAHANARTTGGRVNPRNRRLLLMRPPDFARALGVLYKLVGWLAAGWNAAAKKLNVRLPSWITRHGTAFGEVKVKISATTFRLELSNVVKFVGDVKGYGRRIQKAVDYQAKKMQRQADFLVRQALRRAGW